MILASHSIHLNADSIRNYTIVRIVAFPTLSFSFFLIFCSLLTMIKHQKSVNIRNIPEMLLYCQENTNQRWENLQLQAPAVTVLILFVVLWLACVSCVCV